MQNIKNILEKSIKNIRNGLMGSITSVLKNKTVYVRLSDDEEIRDVKIISPSGFFSLPSNGQNAQLIFNGSSKKASLIGVEHESVPVELKPGEAIVYCQSGSYILLKDGKIFIKGDTHVEGNIYYSGSVLKE